MRQYTFFLGKQVHLLFDNRLILLLRIIDDILKKIKGSLKMLLLYVNTTILVVFTYLHLQNLKTTSHSTDGHQNPVIYNAAHKKSLETKRLKPLKL